MQNVTVKNLDKKICKIEKRHASKRLFQNREKHIADRPPTRLPAKEPISDCEKHRFTG